MIKTTDILRESIDRCPYLRERQREQKRRIQIQDEQRNIYAIETDGETAIERMKEKIRKRTDRTIRNRWIRMATDYIREIEKSTDGEKKAIRKYLSAVRSGIEATDTRKSEGHAWVRTKKLVMNEETDL